MIVTICLLYKTLFALGTLDPLVPPVYMHVALSYVPKIPITVFALHLVVLVISFQGCWILGYLFLSHDWLGYDWGCLRSMWSWSISSSTRYCWHTLYLLCCESKCPSKSQGNINSLIHILHHLNSALWYLVTWLHLYMLLLKKWLHASHSLSYSPVQTSKPFTSSTSTWGSLLPAGTLGSFELGSFSGVGSFGGWLPWLPFSLVGSWWGIPPSPGSGGSGGWSPWSPTSTEVPRELISCSASLWSSSLYSAEKRKKQILQP